MSIFNAPDPTDDWYWIECNSWENYFFQAGRKKEPQELLLSFLKKNEMPDYIIRGMEDFFRNEKTHLQFIRENKLGCACSQPLHSFFLVLEKTTSNLLISYIIHSISREKRKEFLGI